MVKKRSWNYFGDEDRNIQIKHTVIDACQLAQEVGKVSYFVEINAWRLEEFLNTVFVIASQYGVIVDISYTAKEGKWMIVKITVERPEKKDGSDESDEQENRET